MSSEYYIVETIYAKAYYSLVHRKFIISKDIQLNEQYEVYFPLDGEENLPDPIPKVHRRIDFVKNGGVYWARIRREFRKFKNPKIKI